MRVLMRNSQTLFALDMEQLRTVTKDVLRCSGIERDLSILLTDNKGIQKINKEYFNKDRPTNVISFSYMDGLPCEVAGDLIISLERAHEEAESTGTAFYERIFSLIIHGLLHIQGYDHETGERQARRMRYREKKLLTYVRNHQRYKEPSR